MDEFTSVVQSNISSLRRQQNEFLEKVNSVPKIIPQPQYVSVSQSPSPYQSSDSSPRSPPPSPIKNNIEKSNMNIPSMPSMPSMSSMSSMSSMDNMDNIPILEILMPMPMQMSQKYNKSTMVIEEDNDDDLDKLLESEYKELSNN